MKSNYNIRLAEKEKEKERIAIASHVLFSVVAALEQKEGWKETRLMRFLYDYCEMEEFLADYDNRLEMEAHLKKILPRPVLEKIGLAKII